VGSPHDSALPDVREPDLQQSDALHQVRALLDAAATLAGVTLVLRGRDGRALAWGGGEGPCQECEGPSGGPCCLLHERDEGDAAPCEESAQFISVPVNGIEEELGTLLAVTTGNGSRRCGPEQLVRALHNLSALVTHLFLERSDLELMSGELSTRYEELNLIYGVAAQLGRGGNLHELLRYILEESQATTGSDWVLLSLVDRNILSVSGTGRAGEEMSLAERRQFPALAATICRELTTGTLEPLISPEESEAELATVVGGPVSLLAVPIMVKGNLDGCLAVARFTEDVPFHTNDVKLMEILAEQVSLSLTNWELYENLRRFLLNTVQSLVSAIDAKDSYTRGHSQRVHRLSMLLGKSMGLPPDQLETLHWASLLHDVGKLGVPEGILQKPGSLTDQEFAVMRKHPVKSCEIVAPIPELAHCIPAIRHHHERIDGRGYPDGLRGEEIPLLGRIIAVADVFDALTSDRAYRHALQPAEVRRYIRQTAGKHLDCKVVEIFDRIFPDLIRVLEEARKEEGLPFIVEESDARSTTSSGAGHLSDPVPASH
jgi:HD-GYP domain-containing protein (c-di-GMP phosphodiesterase class II)